MQFIRTGVIPCTENHRDCVRFYGDVLDSLPGSKAGGVTESS
jgi:hypothetical protein